MLACWLVTVSERYVDKWTPAGDGCHQNYKESRWPGILLADDAAYSWHVFTTNIYIEQGTEIYLQNLIVNILQ